MAALLEATSNPDAPVPAPKPRPLRGHGRNRLPDHLPREEVVLEPPAAEKVCASCGEEKACIGHERSEVLEFVPATFKVIEYAREKRACRKCGEGVVIRPAGREAHRRRAPWPGAPRPRAGTPSTRITSPLNRLSGIYERSGVNLNSSTLGDWVRGGDRWPRAYREGDLAQGHRGAPAPERRHRHQGARQGPSERHQARAPVGVPGRRAVERFRLHAGLEGGVAAGLPWPPEQGLAPGGRLWRLPGPLPARGRDGGIEVSCWAHARRGFVEALEAGDVRAAIPVKLIAKLYDIERAAKELEEAHEARRERRQREVPPILAALGKWMADTYQAEPPKSPLAKACYYVIARWESLKRFLEDGRLPIDNTASERELRQVAVGRANYLFAGSDQGGERAAIAYTVIRPHAGRHRPARLPRRRLPEAR
ncbi:MAG: transposase [Anaeromyxobacter sp.]